MEQIVYLNPGDIVTLKLDIPNRPKMIVLKKITSIFKHDSKRNEDKRPVLIGILCRWFTNNKEMQEAVFSTKDLIKV